MASRQTPPGRRTYAYDSAGRLVTVNDASAGHSAGTATTTCPGQQDHLRRVPEQPDLRLRRPAPAGQRHAEDARRERPSRRCRTARTTTARRRRRRPRASPARRPTPTPTTGQPAHVVEQRHDHDRVRVRQVGQPDPDGQPAVSLRRAQPVDRGRTEDVHIHRPRHDGSRRWRAAPDDVRERRLRPAGPHRYAELHLRRSRPGLEVGLETSRTPGWATTSPADGAATYSREPDGDCSGCKARYAVFAWTDLHSDVVGQFTAADTALTGSTAYDPLGKTRRPRACSATSATSRSGPTRRPSRVNMQARWYNPATGQFDNRDTADNGPVPDSIDANRYQYGDGDPLIDDGPDRALGLEPDQGHQEGRQEGLARGVARGSYCPATPRCTPVRPGMPPPTWPTR